jgi:hypothetical protein
MPRQLLAPHGACAMCEGGASHLPLPVEDGEAEIARVPLRPEVHFLHAHKGPGGIRGGPEVRGSSYLRYRWTGSYDKDRSPSYGPNKKAILKDSQQACLPPQWPICPGRVNSPLQA